MAERYSSYARKAGEAVGDDWYRNIEKAKDKARRFQNKIMAVDQKTSVVVGIVTTVDVDKLWKFNYPYCKVNMIKAVRFGPEGNVESNIGDAGVFWLNNPDSVLSVEDLSKKYPKVHSEVLVKIRSGGW